MSGEMEPAKLLLPYLQRADELQKHEPLVAYYCRLFAMEKGLKIPPKERTKTTNSILISLMNQLEKDKKTVKLSLDDNLYLEGFASNVFVRADKQDRAGRADLNTAKTFYAASIFFEILHQFGELQPDIEQKQKYALWKAADVRKALKEGRKPQPGPPGGEDDISIFSETETTPNDVAPSESSPTMHTPRSESFSARERGPDTKPPPHARALSSPPIYPGSDLPSSGLQHSSMSARHDDSAYQQTYSQISQPPEQHIPPTFHHSDTLPRAYPHELQPPPSYPHEPTPRNYPCEGSTPHDDTLPQAYPHELQPPPNYPHDPSLQNYPREGSPPQYFYPNFQTYPSFSESSLPTTSGQHSPYYQGLDNAYAPQQQQPPTNYYAAESTNRSHAGHTPQSVGGGGDRSNIGQTPPSPSVADIPSYIYDSNYQPSVEKIAEAHKAARFAVGALAFDDVPVAVEFLRKSLKLLTNPNAESH